MSNTTRLRGFQAHFTNACASALRVYTHLAPFKRGRGVFIRLIEFLKRRGWTAPSVEIGEGLLMEFEPSLLGWTLFERGEWEPLQTAVLMSLIQSGDVVVNAGANTGYYTLLAARTVGRSGRVHAFEIQPAMIDILRRNVALNDFEDIVAVVEAGCFSSAGEAVIESHGDPGSARISFAQGGLRVPLVTLDQYAETALLDRVDVILIDAEGADFEILKGAAHILLTHHPAVIAEVHHLEAFGGSEADLRTFMTQFGYVAQTIQGEFSRDLLFRAASLRANQYGPR